MRGSFQKPSPPYDGPRGRKFNDGVTRGDGGATWRQPGPRRALTCSFTALPSTTCPASRGIRIFITLPMSLRPARATLRHRCIDQRGESSLIESGRQVAFEDGGLALFLVGEFLPTGGSELRDAVLPLLDERRHHLERLGLFEITLQFDTLVGERRLEHPHRVQSLLIARAESGGKVGIHTSGQRVGHLIPAFLIPDS